MAITSTVMSYTLFEWHIETSILIQLPFISGHFKSISIVCKLLFRLLKWLSSNNLYHSYKIHDAIYVHRSDSDPLLQKYGKDKSTQFIWHAELANDIVPRECEMKAGDKEFLLKKRDPSQWTSGLLQCNSASAVSSRSSSISRLRSSTYALHSVQCCVSRDIQIRS